MLSRLALDEELLNIQTEFLLDDSKTIQTFYNIKSKSCLLCEVLGHDYFSFEEYEELKLSEIITFCLRCKIETIEKFRPRQKIPDLIN